MGETEPDVESSPDDDLDAIGEPDEVDDMEIVIVIEDIVVSDKAGDIEAE